MRGGLDAWGTCEQNPAVSGRQVSDPVFVEADELPAVGEVLLDAAAGPGDPRGRSAGRTEGFDPVAHKLTGMDVAADASVENAG